MDQQEKRITMRKILWDQLVQEAREIRQDEQEGEIDLDATTDIALSMSKKILALEGDE